MIRDDEIAREAARREASHEHHASNMLWLRPENANHIGLRGEELFGKEFDMPVDLTPRIAGDKGRDFDFPVYGKKTYKLNCKTALKPKELIVKVEECEPETIYVLCRYLEAEDRCDELLGWQWGSVLMRSVPKEHGYGVLNYWQEREKLRRIWELRLAYRKGFVGYDKDGHFLHYCKCGAWGGKSPNSHVLKGQLGEWFCTEHFPQQPSEEERGQWR